MHFGSKILLCTCVAACEFAALRANADKQCGEHLLKRNPSKDEAHAQFAPEAPRTGIQ
jgi:hypothetical protein